MPDPSESPVGLSNRLGLTSLIARNSLYLLAGEGFARALNFCLVVLLYRHLGPEQSGTMRFVMAYGVLFCILADLGVTRASVREMARLPREQLPEFAGRLAQLRAILCVLYLGVVWGALVVPTGGATLEPGVRALIVIWSLGLAAQAWRRNAEAVFQATEKMHLHSGFLVLNRVIAVMAMAWVVVTGRGLVWVFVAYFAADLFDALAASATMRRHVVRPRHTPNRTAMRGLLLVSLPFGLQLFAVQVYSYIDSMMIHYLYEGTREAANREIGWYQAAFQIVFTLQFIPLSLGMALYPQLARYHQEDPRRMASLFARSYPLFLLAGLPLTALLFALRGECIGLVYGPDYGPSAAMMGIVMWALPFIFLFFPISNLLAAADRQGWVTLMAFLQAGLNVGLNWWLVPERGGAGAALAQTLTMAAAFGLFAAVAVARFRGIIPVRALLVMLPVHAAGLGGVCLADGAGLAVRGTIAGIYGAVCGVWALSIIRSNRHRAA